MATMMLTMELRERKGGGSNWIWDGGENQTVGKMGL